MPLFARRYQSVNRSPSQHLRTCFHFFKGRLPHSRTAQPGTLRYWRFPPFYPVRSLPRKSTVPAGMHRSIAACHIPLHLFCFLRLSPENECQPLFQDSDELTSLFQSPSSPIHFPGAPFPKIYSRFFGTPGLENAQQAWVEFTTPPSTPIHHFTDSTTSSPACVACHIPSAYLGYLSQFLDPSPPQPASHLYSPPTTLVIPFLRIPTHQQFAVPPKNMLEIVAPSPSDYPSCPCDFHLHLNA